MGTIPVGGDVPLPCLEEEKVKKHPKTWIAIQVEPLYKTICTTENEREKMRSERMYHREITWRAFPKLITWARVG